MTPEEADKIMFDAIWKGHFLHISRVSGGQKLVRAILPTAYRALKEAADGTAKL